MTKDEALRMAIEWLDNQQLGYSGHSVRKACQEALEPQPKQPKYLYAYYRDKVYFLRDKDASNRYYIGKMLVNDD